VSSPSVERTDATSERNCCTWLAYAWSSTWRTDMAALAFLTT